MTVVESPLVAPKPAGAPIFAVVYRILAYFGLISVFGSLIHGFHYEPEADWGNYGRDVALYAAFIVPHLILTRSWWKRAAWGNPAGTPVERRFYITLTLITWFAVLLAQWPLPGFELELPEWVTFAGVVAFLWGVLLFFEGATGQSLDGLLGVPGAVIQYSHGSETPLYTEGPYAQVRHPMYRAAILAGAASLVVHPHAAQVLWVAMIGATFLAFIPVEESQLLAARGDDYRRYCEQTPYRLFRGVW